MTFVKVYKNTAYFKRYQTKYRRRREGKTDYYARKRLIIQDRDKYNAPKYRFVVRVTCSKVICQIIFATLLGDKVLASSESTELRRFGMESGLNNYSAAYATGLLLARRILKTTGLDKLYPGQSSVSGEYYNVGENVTEDRRPFKAFLDVGLTRTTNGNRVFAALKGAVDGGLYVPHSTKRFPGHKEDAENDTYDAKLHRDRILGAHVDNYMKHLKGESNEDYTAQFSKWDATLKKTKTDSVQKLVEKVHAEIRKNPERVKKPAKASYKRDHTKYRTKKLNAQEKKKRAAKKIEIAAKRKGK